MHQLTLLRLDRSQFAQKTLFDLRRPWGHFYCICVWGRGSKWCCKKTLRQRSMDPRSSKPKSFFALQHNIEHLKVIKSFQQCEESISRWLFRKHDLWGYFFKIRWFFEEFRTFVGEYTSPVPARLTCVRGLPRAILHSVQQYPGLLLSNYCHF